MMSVSVDDIDHGWFAIKKELKKFRGSYTAIGFFGHGGDPSEDIAARAGVNEYGSIKQKIPSRPFTRQTFDRNHKKINNQIVKEYNAILNKKQTSKKALIRLGLWYKALTQLTIRKGDFIDNKPATIKRKRGSSKPLIDTGQMVNSIEHREFKI
jgi:hypothetical protein